MSKRDTSQVIQDGHSIFIKDLEGLGYIPEGVVNWIALMGWSYDDRTEFFTLRDLVEIFNVAHLNPSPAAINFTKLDYFNGLHIRNLSREDLAHRLAPYIISAGFHLNEKILYQAIPIIRERLVTLDDVITVAGFFFKKDVTPDPNDLVAEGLTSKESAIIARKAYQVLASLPQITKDQAEAPMRNLVDESGLKAGQVFGILRVAVTGQKVSPPLFESMEIIGKDKVLERIQSAIDKLERMQSLS
jgi:glutamyl-tRNA synthetase